MVRYVINNGGGEDIVPLFTGEHECRPSHGWGPHVRNHFIVHFCLEGRGVLSRCDGDHPVCAGDLFIIREGEETTYTADAIDPWHYIWIGFVGRSAEIFRGGDAVRRAPAVITTRLKELIDAREGDPYAYTALIYMLMHELYSAKEPVDRLAEVEKYIKYSYMEDMTVDRLGRLFGFERTYLYRIFKQRYGLSPKEYLTAVRMEQAKKLIFDGYSVKNTSYMVGYQDEFNFSKAYKRFYGESPKSARNKRTHAVQKNIDNENKI